jgi:hypothetical protein
VLLFRVFLSLLPTVCMKLTFIHDKMLFNNLIMRQEVKPRQKQQLQTRNLMKNLLSGHFFRLFHLNLVSSQVLNHITIDTGQHIQR